MSVSYFDCTNYYFDIGRPDVDWLDEDGNPVDREGNRISAKYRKRGPEKKHRPDPIVEMGLLMDKNGSLITFLHKSRIYPKGLQVNITKPGQKKPVKKKVVVDQKQMVYYSEKYAKKQRRDRAAMIERAKDRSPNKPYRQKGSSPYIYWARACFTTELEMIAHPD